MCVIFWFGNDFVHYILFLFFFATADIGQPCVCCCLPSGKLEILQWTRFHRRKYTSSFLWGWLLPVPKASEHGSALYTGIQTRAVRVCYLQFIYWVHESSLLGSDLPCQSYFYHIECTPSGYLCYLMLENSVRATNIQGDVFDTKVKFLQDRVVPEHRKYSLGLFRHDGWDYCCAAAAAADTWEAGTVVSSCVITHGLIVVTLCIHLDKECSFAMLLWNKCHEVL